MKGSAAGGAKRNSRKSGIQTKGFARLVMAGIKSGINSRVEKSRESQSFLRFETVSTQFTRARPRPDRRSCSGWRFPWLCVVRNGMSLRCVIVANCQLQPYWCCNWLGYYQLQHELCCCCCWFSITHLKGGYQLQQHCQHCLVSSFLIELIAVIYNFIVLFHSSSLAQTVSKKRGLDFITNTSH